MLTKQWKFVNLDQVVLYLREDGYSVTTIENLGGTIRGIVKINDISIAEQNDAIRKVLKDICNIEFGATGIGIIVDAERPGYDIECYTD